MNVHERHPFEPVGGTETPEAIALQTPRPRLFTRRNCLIGGMAAAAVAAAGAGAAWWSNLFAPDDEVVARGAVPGRRTWTRGFPGERDERFTYGRLETDRAEAARYTNFYEFSRYKWCWKYVDQFQPEPWSLSVTGRARNPLRLDLDDLMTQFGDRLCERQYRHRCVERWAMAVPWVGIPLHHILLEADPLPSARYVRFLSFERPSEAPHQRTTTHFPWPYQEGLTIDEALNDLVLLAVGMYGKPLLKQHGAPLRLVVPWKYGYKSIKSVQQIEFVTQEPATFWSTLNPAAYPFESNVDPDVPRPWDQSYEWMLGTRDEYPTQKYNGYSEYVG